MISEDMVHARVLPFLSPSRLIHTENTVAVARELAVRFNANTDYAVIAAWCHDICKRMQPKDLVAMQVPVRQQYRELYAEYHSVWHAFAAPAVMTYHLNIQHPKILSAVRWHTTGRARMTLLEAIIFVADYIEPGRTIDGVEEFRKAAFQDVFKAVWLIAGHTIQYLKDRPFGIHPRTYDCYNFYTSIYV